MLLLSLFFIFVYSKSTVTYQCSHHINGKQTEELNALCLADVQSFLKWDNTEQGAVWIKIQDNSDKYECVQLDIQKIHHNANLYIPATTGSNEIFLGGTGPKGNSMIEAELFPILNKDAWFILEVRAYSSYVYLQYELKKHDCPLATSLRLLQPLHRCRQEIPCSCGSNEIRNIVKDKYGCASSCSCESLLCSASYPNSRIGCYQKHMLGNSRNNQDDGTYTWNNAKLGETKELELYSLVPNECVQYRISRVLSGKLRISLSSSSEKILVDSNRGDNAIAEFLIPTLQFGQGFKVKVHSLKNNQKIQFKYTPRATPCPVVLQSARACQMLTSEPSAIGTWLSAMPTPRKRIGWEGYPPRPFPITACMLIHKSWVLANAPLRWRKQLQVTGLGTVNFGNETSDVNKIVLSNTTGFVLLHLSKPISSIKPVILNSHEITEMDGEVTYGEISVLGKNTFCMNDGRTAVTGEGTTLWQTVHSMKVDRGRTLGGVWLKEGTVIAMVQSTGINPYLHRISSIQPASEKHWIEETTKEDHKEIAWRS